MDEELIRGDEGLLAWRLNGAVNEIEFQSHRNDIISLSLSSLRLLTFFFNSIFFSIVVIYFSVQCTRVSSWALFSCILSLLATILPVARTGLRPNFLINVVSENFERKSFIFRSGLPEEARIKMVGKS